MIATGRIVTPLTLAAASFTACSRSEAETVEPAHAAAAEKPSAAEAPAPPLDEELFVAYVVNDVYAHWPTPGPAFASTLAAHRNALAKLSQRCWQQSASEMAVLVDQTEKMLDLFESFLNENAMIAEIVAAQAERDADATWIGATIAHAKGVAKKLGPWGMAGVVVGSVVESAITSSDLSEAEIQLLESRRSSFLSELEARATYFNNTVAGLAKQHGWRDADLEFGREAIRPRDPLQRVRRSQIDADQKSAIALVHDAEACVRATEVIPEHETYLRFTKRCLETAARIAVDAAQREWTESGLRFGGAIAMRAAIVCTDRLTGTPDPTDVGKYQLARCLNLSGSHEMALTTALRAKGQQEDPHFAYDLACILCMNGRESEALDWLRKSFRLGRRGVVWARDRDPNLAALRDEPAFEALFEIRWKWRLDHGALRHDAILENLSDIPLTEIVFKPSIDRDLLVTTTNVATELKLDYLGPRQSHPFENAFFDRPASEGKAHLHCAESR